jgi:hypothetical protein
LSPIEASFPLGIGIQLIRHRLITDKCKSKSFQRT